MLPRRYHLCPETHQAAAMSNSQEQSLDENAVFPPVNEFSPEFLHCEKERQAVERLLNAGPEAFYSSIGTERSGCFLSSEEVSQISSWAQDYRSKPQPLQSQENGEKGSSEMEDVCSTYFPSQSDTPAPDLDLGWPEKGPWVPKRSVTVHTSPPADGQPPVRQIVRRHLQKAGQVIAIATDRLTDGAIIGDLHNAASRGVPVYIILNQRSIQENFTLNRLRHPNMRVRVLGGKTFCSRTGRMVVGEMKDKFLLVDLETVIHGSFSLTWTDAHLHRQLITVLSGPVVESFDREFRILFAASLPITDTWSLAGIDVDVTHQLKERSDLGFKRSHHLEPEMFNPPSPPADCLLDWEAMGVIQRNRCFPESPLDQHEEIMAKEIPLQSNMLFMKNTPIVEGFRNQFVERKRVYENTSPVTNNVPDKSPTFKYFDNFHSNTQPWLTDPTTQERMKRVDHIIHKAIPRQLSIENSTNLDDQKTTRLIVDKATEPTHDIFILSSSQRRERSRTEAVLEDESSVKPTSSKVENTPSSRKPLILRMPQSESFSSLSDIMKKVQPRHSTPGLGSQAAVSDLNQSMMELSAHNPGDDRVSVPRIKASGFDPDYMTPAIALMKKRNEELKPSLYITPTNFLPRERPRSSSYAFWRRSLAETVGEEE
ncbi:protein FAM83A isoform X2 [Cyclopterus lumpus]|uniref:protein FAM83A isoform X2 n=1 Tax=Cyclopterus lumpus TaxID=8103 RepID=UPI001486155A|nr:protein FAM83A isoform X2 [Cyclopterus lumpus]